MMKTTLVWTMILFTLSLSIGLPHTAAEDPTQLGLPEGVKARLGKGDINEIAYSPDGTLLAVASQIGIWLYDIDTLQERALLTGHTSGVTSVSFSPDGNTIASGSEGGTVRLWDVATTTQTRTLTGHTGSVTSVSFSPDGNTIASGSSDNTVRLWDVNTGLHLRTFTGHTRDVESVSFSSDGQTLASSGGSWDDTVRLWDVNTGRHLRTLTGHTGAVYSVSFSPDGQTLASGSWKEVRLWDVNTGSQISTLTGDRCGCQSLQSLHTGWVYSVSFSPDGETLASGSSDDTVRLWDANTGSHLQTLTGHTSAVYSVSFSPDGQTLASGSSDGTVRLWDVNTGRQISSFTGHTSFVFSVSFSPDGQTIASNDSVVRLWDVNTGRQISSFTGHTSWVYSVSFSPDGQTLASGSGDGTVLLWDANTGSHLRTFTGHTDRVYSVSFSPDGETLASGSSDNTVLLWDANTGSHLRTFTGHTDRVWSVSFSPDGETLASGSSDGTVRLWDANTGLHLRTFTGHTDRVWGVSFSPDGETLASGSSDNTVLLWDANTGSHLRTFTGHTGGVYSVSFSPDGQTIASGSRKEVHLWDVNSGQHLQTFTGHTGVVFSVSFSPDGQTLASASNDGTVLLWDLTRYLDIDPTDSQQPQQDSDMVRLVYFRPSDRTVQQGIDAHLTTLIKDVQRFYATQMQRYGGKTFTLETDSDGNPVVHHLDGNFTDVYYQQGTYDKIREEIAAAFDIDKHIYLVAVDVSNEVVNDGGQGEVCGIGGGGWQSEHDSDVWKRNAGGLAVIPASGNCFNVGITAHELGHTFGLEHDFRDETYLMGYGSQTRLSPDAAEWLSVHRYFNTGQTSIDQDTTLTAVSLRASELKFQLTDADGLHQVQLLIHTTASDPAGGLKLHSSKRLNGETDTTVTFAVPELTDDSIVTLQMIDMHGHITQPKETFYVEADSVVEVPDVPVEVNIARVSLSPASVWPGNVGDQLTVNANITDGADVRGYQVELTFDSTALRFISSTDAGYLPTGAFVVPPVLTGNRVTLSAISLQQSSEGDGTLATFTFEVLTASPAMPTLSDVKLTDSNANSLAVQIETDEIEDSPQLAGDINGDGVVSLDDMRTVVARLGQTGENTADMNGDGVVDAADLLLIIDAIEAAAAGPALSFVVLGDMFTATEVRQWLSFARTKGLTDGRYQRGFLLLEQFLLMLTPKETLLLANYPNPFNPETWIPYQLAKLVMVNVSIYAADGKLIRTLSLGHQAAGVYHNRSRAAYWDGKNDSGESAASGVYFYTLTAGDFTATRKMLILK